MSESQYDRLDDLRSWDRRYENIASERGRYRDSDVRNTARALQESLDSVTPAPSLPVTPLGPDEARARLAQRILVEIPNDTVIFPYLDATCIENMRATYESREILPGMRAGSLLAWAVAGVAKYVTANPGNALLEARLLLMRLMQKDLLALDKAVLQARMRGE